MERVGQIVSRIAKHQGFDFRFAGPEYLPGTYSVTPDFAIMDERCGRRIPLVVGEAKTYWVEEHCIEPRFMDFVGGFESDFREMLGMFSISTIIRG